MVDRELFRARHTVHRLTLHLINPFILRDEELKLLVRICDGPYLVVLRDIVSLNQPMSVRLLFLSEADVKGDESQVHPRASRYGGNSGSLGKLVLSRRNIPRIAAKMWKIMVRV